MVVQVIVAPVAVTLEETLLMVGAVVSTAVVVKETLDKLVTETVVVYVPAVLPTVKVVEAWPLLFEVVLLVESDCPLAPPGVEEIEKETVDPDTGFEKLSVTVTTSGLAMAEEISADWESPDVLDKVLAEAAETVIASESTWVSPLAVALNLIVSALV